MSTLSSERSSSDILPGLGVVQIFIFIRSCEIISHVYGKSEPKMYVFFNLIDYFAWSDDNENLNHTQTCSNVTRRAFVWEGGHFSPCNHVFNDFMAENESKSGIFQQMHEKVVISQNEWWLQIFKVDFWNQHKNKRLKIQYQYISPSVSSILYLRSVFVNNYYQTCIYFSLYIVRINNLKKQDQWYSWWNVLIMYF